jgi:spore coat polysaccharide biosynthesis protein SpsF
VAFHESDIMILAILQGRLSSTRLPGKVLKDLHGKPMIVRQIERIQQSSKVDKLVVATSVDPSDDKLAIALTELGVDVRRGPLDDVVERFRIVIDEFKPETVVRLTADCPLADPDVIDFVIEQHLENGGDYTSNVLKPTYPDGLDVECIRGDSFRRMCELDLSDMEREHVTMGLYSRPVVFSLQSIEQEPNRSQMRWTVDVADDLEFARLVYSRLYDRNPRFRQDDIVALVTSNPELSRTDADVARNSGLNT